MNEYIPYVIFGLATGSVYGLSAMGLVLTYKTSGLFNLAHGAVCAASAYAFYDLRQEHGVPWPIAAVLAVGVFGVVLGLVLERISALLAPVTTTFKIVATIGMFVAINYTVQLIYGPKALFFDPFLPTDEVFSVQGVSVDADNLIFLGLGTAAAVGLYVFFRVSRLGVAMRGVVDNPGLLDLNGTDPTRVRRTAWMIGSIFAAASGVLFASVQRQLDVNILSLLVVQAFGAAAIGLFRSLPMAFVGGLIVGVVQKLISKEAGTHDYLQGLDTNAPFIILFIVLLVAKRNTLVDVGASIKAKATPASVFTPRTRAGGYLVGLVVLLAVPQFVGSKLAFYNTAMSQVVLFLSLSLLVRTSGQISLCHVGFAAIGASGFGHMLGHGVPWGIAVLVGGLIAVPIGALIAIPAIRLSGLYLGLATLGFGILLAQYAYGKEYMFGAGFLATRRPDGFSSDTKFYYLLLGIAFAALALVVVIERSRLGRLLRGLADSPLALTTVGANVNITRTIVFCISAFLAGISGATYASLFGAVNQDSFNYVSSLIVLAILAISGRRTVTTAFVCAFLYQVLPGYLNDEDVQRLTYVLFGLTAIAVSILSQRQIADAAGRWASNAEARLVGPLTTRLGRLPVSAGANSGHRRRGGRAGDEDGLGLRSEQPELQDTYS
ncbi:ABC transporter permease [Sporichthya sp.]|uniref:branched-chain amino acid ABC transporter permease n=1 Tax=Sporichthya sp. TaxID=65475 RepID=UPI0025D5674A|nr:ABC transporter permease [Sporichthya sp.]